MAGVISEEKSKELLAKRKYYREHPEEAKENSVRFNAGKFIDFVGETTVNPHTDG